ncbi:caspase family protein [Aliarcobacter thereius]|uniref:caspase family protein n=1 Tax=Aliarcobacter thereius TaxID=544718 RepID=UPI00082429AA|nr:caspase family protein [Aliarcobacter thereius]OCL93957.1 WD domain, G-beta repeat [Aliarcobacter thereius]
MKKSLLLFIAIIFLFFGCTKTEPTPKEKNIYISDIKWDGKNQENLFSSLYVDKDGNIKESAEFPHKTLNGHNDNINSIAISPDNKYLVSGGLDKTIKIWDINSGKLLNTLYGHTDRIWTITISKNSKYIISGSADKTIKIWDFNSGKLLNTLKGHTSSVNSIAISPDSKYLFSGSLDKTIKIWDINSAKLLNTLYGHSSGVLTIKISPDNKYLFSGSFDKTIKIWDINSAKLLNTLHGHSRAILTIAISSDSKYLFSGSADKTIKIWDINSTKLLNTLHGHTDSVLTIATSPDNKYLVSGAWDKTIQIWDINSAKILNTLYGHTNSVWTVVVSADNKYLISGSDDNTIKVWNFKPEISFNDLSKTIQKSLNDFLYPPLIQTPSLPSQEDLVKSQFESKSQFEQRIQETKRQRDIEILKLQEKYRKDVEIRNSELEKKRARADIEKIQITQKNINLLFGKPILSSFSFDAENNTAYADLSGETSSFKQRISFKIEPENAKKLFENLNASSHSVIFEYGKDGDLYIKDINIALDSRKYSANLTDKSHRPELIRVSLENEKLANIEQNPNLIDNYETKIIEFKGDRKDDLPSMVTKMNQAPINPKNWLFVFAVENYDETDSVLYAKNSAEQFAKAIQKRAGISNRNSYIYIDSKATSSALNDHLNRFLNNVKQGDTVYFYYSGHGIPDPKSGEAYLLPKDKIVDYVTKEESLKARNIYNRLSSSNASKVVAFVDACFSGKTDNISNYKGVAAGLFKSKDIEFNKNKMTIFTAGSNKQFSNAHPDKPHRLFSYYLVETMAKEPKLDLDLLYSKVYTKVKDTSWNMGDVYQQEPTKEGKINFEF